MTHAFVSLLIGLAAGVLSGMFGVGGAIISTPALRLLLHVAPLFAVGTTLPVVLPAAMSGGLVYWRRGLIEKRLILPIAAGGVGGSLLGAFLTRFISGHALLVVTAVVIVGIGGQFTYEALTGGDSLERWFGALQDRESAQSDLLLTVSIGTAAGIVSGLLGVGGAIVLNPALVFGLRVPIKKAFGTSLLIIAILAIPGSLVHAALGHIDWNLAGLLALGVVPGGYLGARVTARAKSRTVGLAFGLFLLAVALILGVSELASLLL
ncbi:MAG: sulfite exporter TauE/SafE family protein [Actinomycetota bacterium]